MKSEIISRSQIKRKDKYVDGDIVGEYKFIKHIYILIHIYIQFNNLK